MKRTALPLEPGTPVTYSNGKDAMPSHGQGTVVKAHPKSGQGGSYEIKPDGSDGRTAKLTRKAQHVTAR